MSKEFGDNQNYEPCGMKIPAGLSTSKIAELHQARWTALFDHMDEALSEEEKQLVSAKTHNYFVMVLSLILVFLYVDLCCDV
jgi:hypothetical protein